MRIALILLLCLLPPLTAAAQDEAPSTLPIGYGEVVEGTLTQTAFYDWWQIQVEEGDEIIVEMTGYEGLEPLIGILNESGTLVARSIDGEANTLVDLVHTAESTGQYTIVATRAGNENGTSAGRYQLRTGLGNPRPVRENPYEQVVFLCGADEVANAASLSFTQDPASALPADHPGYRITVYGLDGFQPVIRVSAEPAVNGESCTGPADGAGIGDTITLPDGEAITVTEDNAVVAHLTLPDVIDPTLIRVTVGSVGGAPGRYLATVGGLAIDPAAQIDGIEARLGPRAAQSSSLLVYMVGEGFSRLDPYLVTSDGVRACDDAGRRGCEEMPPATGAGLLAADGYRLLGDRFDAGMAIPQGELAPLALNAQSFNSATSGAYGLLVIGALGPPTPGEVTPEAGG